MNNFKGLDCKQMESLQSRTISFLRFPLIVAVVLIHSSVDGAIIQGVNLTDSIDSPIHDFLKELTVRGVAQIAVPLFFFISGFLFFYKTDFSLDAFKTKLLKRFRSLFIPYVFWNLLIIALLFLVQMFLSGMLSGTRKSFAEYDMIDWLKCFWMYDTKQMPINYPLWFIRNLLLIVLFAPLEYYIIKRTKLFLPIVVGILWLTGITHIQETTPLDLRGFVFFLWGAYYSIFRKNFVEQFSKIRLDVAVAAYVVLLALRMYCSLNGISFPLFYRLSVVVGVVASIHLAAWLVHYKNAHFSSVVASSTFVIYAYHGYFANLLQKLWAKFLPMSDATMVLGLIILPIVLVCFGILLNTLLTKYCPAFQRFITGGRKPRNVSA